MRERAEIIRLNHHGWTVAARAKYQQKSPHTVRTSLDRWSNQGMRGLWEKMARGRKRSWKEEDIKYLEICLEKAQRTYNAAQLSRKLAKEKGIHVIFDNVDFRGCGDIGSFPHEGTLCLRNCIDQDGQIIELLNEETVMEECRRRRRGPKMLNGVPIDQLPRFY